MPKSAKAALLLVFVTVFIDLLGFGIVLPLLPRYGKHFRAGGLELGMLMASFSAMQFLFAPVWGRVSDRIGRRPILIMGLAGSTLSYALFGIATSLGRDGQMLGLSALTWLFITRIGAGIAGATIPTAQACIADITGPQERARGMALIGAAFGIGFTFGPLLGAAFVSHQPTLDLNTAQQTVLDQKLTGDVSAAGKILPELEAAGPLQTWQRELLAKAFDDAQSIEQRTAILDPIPSAAPGYVAATLSGIALLFAIFLLPETRRSDRTSAAHRWFDVQQLRVAIGKPAILLVLLTIFLTTFAFAQFESTLSLLTEALGLSARYNFLVFAYIGFVLTISQGVLVRRLVPRLGEFRMSAIGAVLMTIGLALIGVTGLIGSRSMLYAVLPVSVIGFSALTPSLQSLLSRHTSSDDQGGILGLGQSLSALARILGPMLGITLEARDTTWPYWSGTALMVLGGMFVLMLKRFPAPATEAADANFAAD